MQGLECTDVDLETGYKMITLRVKGFGSEFWEKCIIFICVFYTFFMSLCNRLPSGTIVALVLTILAVCGYAFTNHKKLYRRDFLVFVGIFLICLFNCLLFNVEFSEYVRTFLFCFIPMILVGGIIDIRKNYKYIYVVSCIYITFLLIYMVTGYARSSTVYSDYIDYLGFAYYAIPALLFIINYYFETRSKLAIVFAALGILYLAVCGTRGPVLCTFVYLIYCVIRDWKQGNIKRKLFILIILIGGFVVLMNMRSIALYLYPIFQRNGFSTRFFLFFLKKLDVTDLTGRDTLRDTVLHNINQHFVLGSGIMGDRALFGGGDQGYSHNLILEVLYNFGVPLGVVLLALLFGLVAVSFVKTKSKIYREFIAIYTVAAIVKLLFSASFMQESTLFLLIGLCFAGLRANEDNETVESL